jgi:hypothetical protein
MPLPSPVLLQYRGEQVYALRVFPMPDELFALIDGNRYERVGSVRRTVIIRDGFDVATWEAHDAAGAVRAHGKTRHATVKVLLEELGFYPIQVLDTIPALF